MKTSIQLVLMLMYLCAASSLIANFARAETDREYETEMRQRQRDFNSYIKERKSERSDFAKAAEVLHAARKAAEAQHEENERAYQKVMKRYSMEEIEALDRRDDERLLKERAQADASRSLFVEARERRHQIEDSIGPVDPYLEFDINLGVEPETKVSHPGSNGEPVIGGSGGAF
jgi:ATPase subunit of ABC transporter with duplicated ATPase domains